MKILKLRIADAFPVVIFCFVIFFVVGLTVRECDSFCV